MPRRRGSRARRGDDRDMKGFEQLYNEIAPGLTNYLVGSGSSYHDACEIVQETFLRVWRHRDELVDDLEQIRGYVFTVARNCRKNRVRDLSRETLQDEIADAGSYEVDFESKDENAALRKKLLAALAELPPTLREAFTLFQIAELSIREIARQTNVTEANVKVRIHRAKEKLRERLEG